ncbi:MAG: T9SS type A sorting domain-containing protein [Elusimicrobia bacterium]|nr:T9SS type A sorting domain-containing protein [Elusimicrobiota bacterium]
MKKWTWMLAAGVAVSGARAASLEERLRTPFAITANEDASAANPLPLAKEVATFEQILPAWSELHALLPAMTARANQERALGLKVSIGFSPTSIAGLRTDIDLPPWVAAGCGLSTATASFSNPCLQAYFIADATTVAAAVQPDYFHLATEVNTLLLRKIAAPADQEFVNFGLLYRTAHDQVKAVVPACQVFVSFQYDLQKKFERDNPGSWDVFLGAYRGPGPSKLDVVGYTSYPCKTGFADKLFATPWDIPSDYYAAAADHLSGAERPVFSEIGWPSDGSGSEATQRAFADRLPELMAPARPALVVWPLLHDIDPSFFLGNVDLATVGVRRSDGTPKPAWEVLTGAGAPTAGDPFRAVHAYPNPYRPAGGGVLRWSGLPPGATGKIYGLRGSLVGQFAANDFGNAQWNGLDGDGGSVPSGVYFVVLASEGKTKRWKVVLQR